jgi:phosphatidylserine decarboxylase
VNYLILSFLETQCVPNYIDHKHFYSPADGTILYQKYVKDATDPIVEIKGIDYTLQDVLGNKHI